MCFSHWSLTLLTSVHQYNFTFIRFMLWLKTWVLFLIHVHTQVLQFSLCIRLGGLFVCFVYQTWRFSFLHSQLALENEKVVTGESGITSSQIHSQLLDVVNHSQFSAAAVQKTFCFLPVFFSFISSVISLRFCCRIFSNSCCFFRICSSVTAQRSHNPALNLWNKNKVLLE